MLEKSMQFDSKPAMDEPAEEAEETTLLTPTMLGGQTVKPGDVVRLEVVSVDDDGSAMVRYATAKPKTSGIAGLTAKPMESETEEGEM